MKHFFFFIISIFIVNPTLADKKTNYFANKCFIAAKNYFPSLKFSSKYRHSQIQKGTDISKKPRHDRELCEALGGCDIYDHMYISIYVILPWGGEEKKSLKCDFNDYGDVRFVKNYLN